ncbi:hypothetical protein LVJ94_06170 [Pendulispora rubella]|uniref:Uncharacterized protein n=1 Tax=Pendulispora rubella TaxID=2741070 RepID=A0ABZ2L7B0_9BACT
MMQRINRYPVEALAVLARGIDEALFRAIAQVALLDDARSRCDLPDDAFLARSSRFFRDEMQWLAARKRYLSCRLEAASSWRERRTIHRLCRELEQLNVVLTLGERLVDALTERTSKNWCVVRARPGQDLE